RGRGRYRRPPPDLHNPVRERVYRSPANLLRTSVRRRAGRLVKWRFGSLSEEADGGRMQVNGQPVPALDDPSLYFNRERSWLQFNRRVLEEAQDPEVPLLERLKFLAIFTSNLDEFFMVRVGGLHQKLQAGIPYGSGADRMPVRIQMERISETVHA